MTDPARCPSCGCELPTDAAPGPCQACLLKAGLADERSGKPRFTPPLPAELQPHFPELEILAPIGHGGMGAVYQARQKRLERIVALKILAPELGKDPAFAERFAREARALARLSHPHLVAVHDFGQSGPWFWILMEHVDGANLRQVLSTGTLSASQALAIVPQLCEALQYAHDEGIVHRDIKPENILLDRRGQAKIADFGLAKLAPDGEAPAEPLTATGDLMGTAHYMAPEQIEHAAAVDHRADLYSLGVVIYEMLTGGLPLGRFEPPSSKAAVDARLDEVVHKALEKDPQRRYQRADEVKTDVERIREAPPVAAAPVPASAGFGPSPETDGVVMLLYGAMGMTLALGQAFRQHDEFALLGLLQAGVVAFGGWHLMQRDDRRWAHAGRVAALVPVSILIWAPGFGIIVAGIAWWYWWSRWKKLGACALGSATQAAAAPPPSTDAAPPARQRPAFAIGFLRFLVVAVLIGAVIWRTDVTGWWRGSPDDAPTAASDDAGDETASTNHANARVDAESAAGDLQQATLALEGVRGSYTWGSDGERGDKVFHELKKTAQELRDLSEEVHDETSSPPIAQRVRRLARTASEDGLTLKGMASQANAQIYLETVKQLDLILTAASQLQQAPENLGAMRDLTFQSLSSRVTECSFDDGRIGVITEAARHYCFTSAQALQLMRAFDFDSGRARAADLLRPRLTDPEIFFEPGQAKPLPAEQPAKPTA
jgi:tRNA A-37 threonylcarbamoyl transferase component Bud32